VVVQRLATFPDPSGIMPGQARCQGTNAGPWLPVTNTVQSLHETDASRVGVKKAIEVSQKPLGCGGLEKWKLNEKKDAHVKEGRDHWDVALTWTRFQCCLGWRGKTKSDSLGSAGGIWTIPPNEDFRFD
jgi:hypothetical protein